MKLKFFVYAAAIMMLFGSCDKVNDESNNALTSKGNLTIRFVGEGFNFSQSPMYTPTRTEVDAAHSDATVIGLFIFKGTEAGTDGWGTPVYTVTQVKTDPSFGTVNCELAPGTYTLAAVANSNSNHELNATITSPEAVNISSESLANIKLWMSTKSVTVSSGNASLDMSMKLSNARLKIVSNSSQPVKARYIKITIGDNTKEPFTNITFSPITGLTSKANSYIREIEKNITEPAANPKYSISLPLGMTGTGTTTPNKNASNGLYEQTLPVKIEVLDANRTVLYTHNLPAVSFRQGTATTMTGNVFDIPSSGSFTFENDYLNDISGTF